MASAVDATEDYESQSTSTDESDDEETIQHDPKGLHILKLQPKFQNIASEFEDHREFVINGEALVMEMLGDSNYDDSCGGQYLHYIYLCERFLLHFIQKGGIVCIAFFDDMRDLWYDQPNCLLARECLRQHLMHNTSLRVITVQNPWDPLWLQYLKDKGVTFIMTTDAEYLDHVTRRDEAVTLFAFQQVWFLSQQLNLSYISGIHPSSNRIEGFFCPAAVRYTNMVKENEDSLKRDWHLTVAKCDHMTEPGDSLKRRIQELKKLDQLKSSSLTAIAGAVVINQVLDNKSTQDDLMLMKLFLLHLVLLRHLTLKVRAQSVQGEVWLASGHMLLVRLQREMAMVLPFVMSNAGGASSQMAVVADVMDGRLLTKLLCLTHTKPNLFTASSLGDAIGDEFGSLWQVIVCPDLPTHLNKMADITIKDNISDPMIDLDELSEMSSAFAKHKKVKTKSTKLLPVDCKLVHEFVGDIYDNMPKTDVDDPDVRRAIKHGIDFDERYHWHSAKPLQDEYEGTRDSSSLNERIVPTTTTRERNWELRKKQKLANYNQWYAESLSSVEKKQTIIVNKKAVQKSGKSFASKGNEKKKADVLKEQNSERIEAEESVREKQRWIKYQEPFKSHREKGHFHHVLKEIDQYLAKCRIQGICNLALMEKVQLLWEVWMVQCNDAHHQAGDQHRTPDNLRMATAAQVMLVVQELYAKACRLSQKQSHRLLSKLTESKRAELEKLPESEREAELVSELTTSERQQVGLLCKKEKELLATIVGRLGFADLAVQIQDSYQPPKDLSERYMVHLSSTRFQLTFMSHYLDRDLRTDPDPRVQHFIPDGWQRELLDAVDNNRSALIVAPTSSGKTYASYYCMEKVLRESDDGVIVYVSPTKALVNQVAATVYGTFEKKLPPGKALHGVFTRDYRTNALNCQVLVTVPQCFEILLLSPERQKWVSKIKYVIFDEVHCLGMELGAEVWEHLLMLIRCPFLALSATIQNPYELRDWLQKGEDLRYAQDQELGQLRNLNRDGYKVGLVIYRERYADLEKYIYLPDLAQKTNKKSRKDEAPVVMTDKSLDVHPLYALTRDKLVSMKEFPGELSFSAKECLQAYDAMIHVWPDRANLQSLDPSEVFGSQVIIHRSEARDYERRLKAELLQWKVDGRLDMIEAVIQLLTREMCEHRSSVLDLTTNSEDDGSGLFLERHIETLISKLNRENKLPALVFSFNRDLCAGMVQHITSSLRRQESSLRKLPAVCHLMITLEDKVKYKEASRHRAESTAKAKGPKRTSQAGDDEQLAILEHDIIEAKAAATKAIVNEMSRTTGKPTSKISIAIDTSNPNSPLPGCSFACKGAMSEEDLDKVRSRLQYVQGHDRDPILEGMRRGVGYHHAGLGNKIRASVELLFRKQHLQMVTATGTLALGIHMPCKSVVFAGDSPYLTSLMFRQMSGRSGRRGFDHVGNVYFFGIGERKIKHIMSSELSEISGNFPVTATLMLRLFLFCNRGNDKQMALNMSLTLLKNPLMTKNKPILQEQIRHFFVCCTQFLMRQGLLDENGNPQGLAGLVTHLHYHEPANFVFVEMLHRGCFHILCSNRNKDGSFPPDVMLTLVTVLANLFTEAYLHPQEYRILKEKSINSKVMLPSLGSKLSDVHRKLLSPFRAAVNSYNKRVKANFHEYMGLAANIIQKKFSTERQLPLSEVSFGAVNENTSVPLVADLERTSTSYKVCSSFAALSGHSDADLWDDCAMIQNIRNGVYCDNNVMPTLKMEKLDCHGNAMIRNGYALDFFRHGSSQCVSRDCGVRPSEVFASLKDFMLTIKTIAVSLAEFGPEKDNVVCAFADLATEYTKKFNKAYQIEDR